MYPRKVRQRSHKINMYVVKACVMSVEGAHFYFLANFVLHHFIQSFVVNDLGGQPSPHSSRIDNFTVT